MAISLRNKSSGADTSGTLTLNKPAGVLTGDVLVAIISQRLTTVPTPTYGSWVSVASNTGGPSIGIWTRVVDGTEPSTFSWTHTDDAAGGILAYSGVNTSTPVNVQSAFVRTSAGATTYSAPSVTTTVANCMLIVVAALAGAGTSLTAPAGFTQEFLVAVSPNDPTTQAADLPQAAAGASGANGGTYGPANNSLCIQFALAPAAALSTIVGKTGTSGTAVMQKTLAGWTNVAGKTGGSATAIDQKGAGSFTKVKGH